MIRPTHIRTAAVVAVAGIALAACGADDSSSADRSDADRSVADTTGDDAPGVRPSFDRSELEELASEQPTSRPTPRGSPSASDLPPATDELPTGILEPVIEDAAARRGVAIDHVEVVRSQPARWSDGSLGCPEPGLNYTQAIVNGYWIVLRADGGELDYRLGSAGGFRLCESGGSPPLVRDDV